MFGNLYHENMRGVRQSQEVKLIPECNLFLIRRAQGHNSEMKKI